MSGDCDFVEDGFDDFLYIFFLNFVNFVFR